MVTENLGRYKTKMWADDKYFYVAYDGNVHVKFNFDSIILDTCGRKTVTKKNRMNQASKQFGLGFQIRQLKFQWFIVYQGRFFEFENEQVTLQRKMNGAHEPD